MPPATGFFRPVTFTAVAIFVLTFPLGAQKLTLGLVAGTSVTADVQDSAASYSATTGDGETESTTIAVRPGSRGLIIGPRLELRLPWNFSLEAEALHRALHLQETDTVSTGTRGFQFRFTETPATWEFPVLGRYHLRGLPLAPFLEAGPSLRPAGSGSVVSHWGATAGAGIALHSQGFQIAPEIRYTHWKALGSGPIGTQIQDQVELLVGVSRNSTSTAFASAFGKRFSLGLLVGAGLGDDLESGTPTLAGGGAQRSDSNSLIAGALLEVDIHRDLYLEADGIYRPLHATVLPSALGPGMRYAVLTWEFPVLAKYKFRGARAWRPFAELGPAFRLDGNFNGPTPAHYGATGGAGVEARLWRFKISPAVRYSRWGRQRTASGGGVFRNEVEGVVGVEF
jgi:hypothetical protein